jgi:hypothetical protein
MTKWREPGSCAGKVRNTTWGAHPAKADTTTAAPDSASNVSGSQSATTKATSTKATAVETTAETSPMETTPTGMEASTTTEAYATTAAVPCGPCYWTERYESDAN